MQRSATVPIWNRGPRKTAERVADRLTREGYPRAGLTVAIGHIRGIWNKAHALNRYDLEFASYCAQHRSTCPTCSGEMASAIWDAVFRYARVDDVLRVFRAAERER